MRMLCINTNRDSPLSALCSDTSRPPVYGHIERPLPAALPSLAHPRHWSPQHHAKAHPMLRRLRRWWNSRPLFHWISQCTLRALHSLLELHYSEVASRTKHVICFRHHSRKEQYPDEFMKWLSCFSRAIQTLQSLFNLFLMVLRWRPECCATSSHSPRSKASPRSRH